MPSNPNTCPTCSGPIRRTVGMVCPDCGTDFAPELDMEAIRARLEAATPGPWESGDVWARAGLVFDDHHNHVGTNNPTKCGYCFTGDPLILAEVMDINGRDMEAHLHRRVEPWDLDEFVSGAGGVVVARKVAGEANVELIAHAPTDLRRLLDENARLNAELHGRRNLGVEYERLRVENIQLRDENDDMRKRVAFAAAVVSGDAAEMLAESLTKVRAELDRVIREAAADKAKLAAVRKIKAQRRNSAMVTSEQLATMHGWNDAVNAIREALEPCECGMTDPSTWEMHGGATEPGSAYEWNPDCPAHGDAPDAAPEMPRPPAEEAAWSDADRVCAFDGCGESCRHDEENPVPPAQEPVSGPETPGTGSGRGTGVTEAPGAVQDGEEA